MTTTILLIAMLITMSMKAIRMMVLLTMITAIVIMTIGTITATTKRGAAVATMIIITVTKMILLGYSFPRQFVMKCGHVQCRLRRTNCASALTLTLSTSESSRKMCYVLVSLYPLLEPSLSGLLQRVCLDESQLGLRMAAPGSRIMYARGARIRISLESRAKLRADSVSSRNEDVHRSPMSVEESGRTSYEVREVAVKESSTIEAFLLLSMQHVLCCLFWNSSLLERVSRQVVEAN